MADAGLKARASRLVNGEFRVDDLTRLFLFARDRCDGRESVQEIGDFVAHHAERTKGIVTRETRDWFLTVRTMISAMDSPLNAECLPLDFRDFLSASLRRIGPGIKKHKMSMPDARRILPNLLKKFRVNRYGTLAISTDHTANEIELLRILSTHITARPAFSSGRLIEDFFETLRSHELLTRNQKVEFQEKAPTVLLFAASVMHNCTVQIDDTQGCKLTVSANQDGGAIDVNAAVPTIANPAVFISSSIFSTGLSPKSYCEEALLAEPSPWKFDLEITPSQKLGKLG